MGLGVQEGDNQASVVQEDLRAAVNLHHEVETQAGGPGQGARSLQCPQTSRPITLKQLSHLLSEFAYELSLQRAKLGR